MRRHCSVPQHPLQGFSGKSKECSFPERQSDSRHDKFLVFPAWRDSPHTILGMLSNPGPFVSSRSKKPAIDTSTKRQRVNRRVIEHPHHNTTTERNTHLLAQRACITPRLLLSSRIGPDRTTCCGPLCSSTDGLAVISVVDETSLPSLMEQSKPQHGWLATTEGTCEVSADVARKSRACLNERF